jgi:hypothetical protein
MTTKTLWENFDIKLSDATEVKIKNIRRALYRMNNINEPKYKL